MSLPNGVEFNLVDSVPDVWLDDAKSRMPVIDSLGDEFLDYVEDGMNIIIRWP